MAADAEPGIVIHASAGRLISGPTERLLHELH
jgi:hypothetical protein